MWVIICLSSSPQLMLPLIDWPHVGQYMIRMISASRQDVPPPGTNEKGDTWLDSSTPLPGEEICSMRGSQITCYVKGNTCLLPLLITKLGSISVFSVPWLLKMEKPLLWPCALMGGREPKEPTSPKCSSFTVNSPAPSTFKSPNWWVQNWCTDATGGSSGQHFLNKVPICGESTRYSSWSASALATIWRPFQTGLHGCGEELSANSLLESCLLWPCPFPTTALWESKMLFLSSFHEESAYFHLFHNHPQSRW